MGFRWDFNGISIGFDGFNEILWDLIRFNEDLTKIQGDVIGYI
jgi:hypothetical protein